jgi:hypothetical protein
MMKRRTILTATLAGTLVVLAAVAGLAEVADSAPQAPPSNQAPPAVSGTPEEGKTLTTSNGTWAGTAPITFAYSWRRCDEDGGSCSQIGGATDRTYVLRKVDTGNTLRSRVTARNADGSVAATSVPTAVVRTAPAPATGCDGNAPIPIANVSLPDRLLIDGQSISPSVVGRSTGSISVRFRVTCKGKPVQGALLYAEPVPFNQFTAPAEQQTGADGVATLTMNRAAGYPATNSQQLLVVFARARKAGENLLAGVSTRRLVSFPVNLSR